MNLMELTQYTSDDEKAEQYLQKIGILKTFDNCPYCGSRRLGRIRRVKIKCYECRKEWGVRKGSILEGMRIPLTKFLLAIKLFELSSSLIFTDSQKKGL